jgi:hypothetical protein
MVAHVGYQDRESQPAAHAATYDQARVVDRTDAILIPPCRILGQRVSAVAADIAGFARRSV